MRMWSSLGMAGVVLSVLAGPAAWGQNPYGPGVRVAQNPQGPINPGVAGPPAPVAGPAVPPASAYGPAAAPNGNPAGPRPAAGPVGQPRPPQPGQPMMPRVMMPDWVNTLTPAHLKHIDDILNFWEAKGKLVNHFECQFERWEYNPTFGPKDPNVAYTYATGAIKFEKPDKGLFKVETLGFYTPPKMPGQQPTFEPKPNEIGEHWVCDGKSIFEFLPAQQVLRETKLPPEMQGKAIANGPLPFMFGMQAAEIKQRYFLRVITPPGAKDQYWLEAWPKLAADAGNYRSVEVILSAKDFLPDAMQMTLPQGRGRAVFQFANRKVNSALPDLLPFWKANDFKPTLPSGWRKQVEDPTRAAPAPTPLGARPATQR